MDKNLITIKPLGGIGEIGANMFLLTTCETVVLIDAGMLFPREDVFGVDFLLPDLSSIERIDALIVTHAHEDHIGAIHMVIKKFPQLLVYAPPFAQSLIQRKLHEKKLKGTISSYSEMVDINIGKLAIRPIRVNHSIPDSFGLFVFDQKNSYCLLYVSDFKTDPANYFGQKFNLDNISSLVAKFKVRLLFADSTNILMDKRGPTEAEIVPNLEKIFAQAPGRIFITAFPSNIARIKTILSIAKAQKKRVVPHGRSVISYIEAAQELKLLDTSYHLTKIDELKDPTAKNLVIFASGCQGDFKGALKRVTSGNDSTFTMCPSDTFIFSSRAIPGNESKVNAIVDEICQAGCFIYTANEYEIHSTGHPSKEELRQLYGAFQPTHAIPVHGTHYFIKRHLEFIDSLQMNISAIGLRAFDELSLTEKLEVNIERNVGPKLTIIHGNDLEIESSAISQKRKIAESGLIVLAISVAKLSNSNRNSNSKNKNNNGKGRENLNNASFAKIKFLGLPEMFNTYQENIREMAYKIKDDLISASIAGSEEEIAALEETLRIAIRKFANNILGYKPITVVQIA